MMRGRPRRLRPVVEPIESRALLSAGLAVTSPAQAMVRHLGPLAVQLDGTIRGQYHTNVTSPDAGTMYLLNGVDSIRGYGLASGLGEIDTPGPGASGYAQGQFALTSVRGTLKFDLTAVEPQSGSQNPTGAYSYNITGGTALFRDAQGGGAATLRLILGPRSRSGYPRILRRFVLTLKPGSLAS